MRKRNIVLILTLLALIIAVVWQVTASHRTNSSGSVGTLENYASGKDNLKLTVGIYKEGKSDYKVYGKDGKELEKKEYEYEIASITKTFTGSILCKALSERKISLEDSIADYLKLGGGRDYPLIGQLATHTAGYGEYPQEIKEKATNMSIASFENPFQGFTTEDLIQSVQEADFDLKKIYGWQYSNFGISVLGTVLGEVYQQDYYTLLSSYIENDLGLPATRIETSEGNLSCYNSSNKKCENWLWKQDEAFIPAAGILSTAPDMMKYAQIQMEDKDGYLSYGQQAFTDISKFSGSGMGLGWLVSTKSNVVWHNGESGGFTSFLGFDKENQIAVVVLSNYLGDSESDVTDIGFQLIEELKQ